MLKEKDTWTYMPRSRYSQGEDIDLDKVQKVIQAEADKYGVPVEFYKDEMKVGNIINSTMKPCLCIAHPEHRKDYFNYCVTLDKQGTYCFITVSRFGMSKQLKSEANAKYSRENRKNMTMTGAAGSLIANGVRALMRDKQALEEEKMYYLMLDDVLEGTIA